MHEMIYVYLKSILFCWCTVHYLRPLQRKSPLFAEKCNKVEKPCQSSSLSTWSRS